MLELLTTRPILQRDQRGGNIYIHIFTRDFNYFHNGLKWF